jgi:hypothetical protein
MANESNITNIFKQIKKKYKVESMVHDIQLGVNKDNFKHILQLEKQKQQI